MQILQTYDKNFKACRRQLHFLPSWLSFYIARPIRNRWLNSSSHDHFLHRWEVTGQKAWCDKRKYDRLVKDWWCWVFKLVFILELQWWFEWARLTTLNLQIVEFRVEIMQSGRMNEVFGDLLQEFVFEGPLVIFRLFNFLNDYRMFYWVCIITKVRS